MKMLKCWAYLSVWSAVLGVVSCRADLTEPVLLPESPPADEAETISLIADFLSTGGEVEYLSKWVLDNAYPSVDMAVEVVSENLDNDLNKEVIVVSAYLAEDVDGYYHRGFLAIFDEGIAAYEMSSITLNGDYLSGIHTIEDINANGTPDIVFVWGFCGVSFCTHEVQVIEWANGMYIERIAESVSMIQARIYLTDHDNDGVWDINVETPGTVSSISYGPRFEEHVLLTWNGATYGVTEHTVGTCQVLCGLLEE